MTAVGYVRVSTGKQDHSLDAQEAKIRAMALVRGVELAEVVVDRDEFSGDLKRPGVQRVIEMVAQRKVSAVIVTKLDRLTRSTRDAIELMELFRRTGVALVSIGESLDTASAIGRCVLKIMASFAELERETIGERTSTVLQAQKAKGLPAGPAPYGWRAQGRTAPTPGKPRGETLPLLEDEAEQHTLRTIRKLRDSGATLQEIAETLNEAGYRTRRGGKWLKQYVSGVLK
jgi:site-specific DNA recombinase